MSSFIQKSLKIENRLDVLPNGRIVTTSKGDLITDNGTKTAAMPVGENGQVLTVTTDSPTGLSWSTAGPDTMSNVGTGTGLFKQKASNEFELKSLVSGSTKLSITNDDNDVSLDVVPINIDILSLLNAPTTDVVGIDDAQILTKKTLGDDLNMDSHKITNLAEPTSNTDAVNKAYVDTIAASLDPSVVSINSFLNAPTSAVVGINDVQTITNKTWGDSLNMDNHTIINLANPVNNNDAATKEYVDSVASGLDVKLSVKVATTDNLESNTSVSNVVYASTDGSSSRGQITATLNTNNLFVVDGVAITSSNNGSRILIKNQVDSAQNGIWEVTISVNGLLLTLDRAADFNTDTEVTSGAFTFVEEGTINSSSGWVLATHNPIVIGGSVGSALSFSQFSGTGQIVAGDGVNKSGNELSVVGSSTIISSVSGVSVNSSNIAGQVLLSSGTVGTDASFGALPLNNSSAVAGLLPILSGGTNASSFTGGRVIASNANGSSLVSTTLDPVTIVTLSGAETLTNKTIDSSANTISNIVNANISATAKIDASKIANGSVDDSEFQRLSAVESSIVGVTDTQTLTNKTIDSSANTISNIVDANISATAAINASKIANGSVSDSEFQRLSAVESDIVGISDTQFLTNKTIDSSNTLVSPKVQTSLKDINNNSLITVVPVENAVNSLSVSNSVTGSSPSLSVDGSDSNIDLNLNAKGTGHVVVSGLSYPTSDGAANQVLTTNGSGSLGFSYVPILKIATDTTTNNTPLVLSNLTTSTVNNTVYFVEAKIVARRSDAGEEGAGFVVRGTYRNNDNTVTEIGTDTVYIGEDGSVWSVNLSINDAEIIVVVTGENGKTIQWGGNVNVTSI